MKLTRITLLGICCFLLAGQAMADLAPGDMRTTSAGAVFTRVTDHPGLGEAWRAPDGLIWGDVVRDAHGNVVSLSQYDAVSACAAVGARLPTQVEFAELGVLLGGTRQAQRIDRYSIALPAAPGEDVTYYDYHGYTPQLLPNLDKSWFWTSTLYPYNADFAVLFSGAYGGLGFDRRVTAASQLNRARCVFGQ